jgi:DNA-binding HxlR family transcriptional regulator
VARGAQKLDRRAAADRDDRRLRQVDGRRVRDAALDLDRVIHERLRLGIVSVLAVHDTVSFNDLKKLVRATDGHLSVHARKLEEAGYVECIKRFEGRVPRTEYRLTLEGREALKRYLSHMEALIRVTKG